MAAQARRLIAHNGWSHVITVLEGYMEQQQIPEPVDIIVSEWMGYFLLRESMLDSVIAAVIITSSSHENCMAITLRCPSRSVHEPHGHCMPIPRSATGISSRGAPSTPRTPPSSSRLYRPISTRGNHRSSRTRWTGGTSSRGTWRRRTGLEWTCSIGTIRRSSTSTGWALLYLLCCSLVSFLFSVKPPFRADRLIFLLFFLSRS